jgi:hypothetical protein
MEYCCFYPLARVQEGTYLAKLQATAFVSDALINKCSSSRLLYTIRLLPINYLLQGKKTKQNKPGNLLPHKN